MLDGTPPPSPEAVALVAEAIGDRPRLSREKQDSESTPPDAKRPLTRDLPPAPEFPGDALGPLRKAAEGLHERVRLPFAIAAQSVLAAATLAVQAHRDVELPNAGRKPLTGIFVTVAESGERKTSCDRLALRAIYRFEEGLREQYGPAFAAYAADREARKAANEEAKKKGKGNRQSICAALTAIGPEPRPPPHPMLLVADPTPEALVLHLQDGRSWAGLFTDEGGTLIGGHAMNDHNRMRTGALLNTLWDGSPIRRLRVGSGKTFLPGRRVSAHVMMQATVASRFFGDETLGGMGTLARALTVAPETAAGTRLFRETTEAAELALQDYDARLTDLLTRSPRTLADDPCVLDPPAMTLDHEARTLWIAFHDHVERDIRPDGDFAPIRAFGSKLAEHAGRLAAVMATYADPDSMTVSAEHMANGILLAQHYARELLRLGEAARVAPDLQLARRLLTWWQARPEPQCHLAAIYQNGPPAVRDAATARRIVALLVEHGWIVPLPAGTELDGKPRRDAWELVR
jgi:hypothetical protein